MSGELLPLIVGLPGPALGPAETEVLREVRPAGVILFARNIESAEQVRALIADLDRLEAEPFVCVDLEGGKVNRLDAIWGPLPAPAETAAAGRRAVRALGTAAGAACRSLGVHLDLAPVIDLSQPAGRLTQEGRCLSDDPLRAVALAGLFADGLRSWSVAGCLKHFPGLGPVLEDTHELLPHLSADLGELEPHIGVFPALSAAVPILMMAHVIAPALGDAERPASLAPAAVRRATTLPGSPVVLSDDLEMGALDRWGDLGSRIIAALEAGNHGVIISKSFELLPSLAAGLRAAAAENPGLGRRLGEAATRMGTLRCDLRRTVAATPAPDDETVGQLWEQARREAASTREARPAAG